MNRLKYSLIAIFAFGSLAVFGQKSTGAAQFPELTPDVRGVGMGNSGVAATANAFSIYRNAAKSIFSTQKAEIGYSFTPWLRELSKGSNLHVWPVIGIWTRNRELPPDSVGSTIRRPIYGTRKAMMPELLLPKIGVWT